MRKLTWLKITLPILLAAIALASFILPVAADIGGTDINISSLGGASPDIEVSSDGTFVAVAYFKQESGVGAVYLKSATASGGWRTSSFLGLGSNPQLVFTGTNIVYVVWAKNGNKAIQSARCTLAVAASPSCSPGADVQTSGIASLDFPDIAVGTGGFIHVAWQNNGVIETARTNTANSLAAWTLLSSPIAGGGADQRPVLAWSNGNGGRLHLAFLRGSDLLTPTAVEYRRSLDTGHNWTNASATFALGTAVIAGTDHDKFDNPTIAASGSNVFLAWDAHRKDLAPNLNTFSLIQVRSAAANGSSWGDATYAPSGGDASLSSGGEIKIADNIGIPAQETGLRSSLAISSTDAALVWREIPDLDGCNNDTSFIRFTTPPTSTANADRLSNDNINYMIDPDIAVASGTRHFVFMRDTTTACPGGLADKYLITYRGPFTNTTNDDGEGGGTFLPLIRKNN